MRLVVRNQRDRDQCKHLEEDVHRDDVGGKRHTQRHAVGHRVEGKENVLSVRLMHVLERIKQHERPHDRHHPREQPAEAVQLKGDGEIVGKAVYGNRIIAHRKYRKEHTQRSEDCDRLGEDRTVFIMKFMQQDPESAQDGQCDRYCQK